MLTETAEELRAEQLRLSQAAFEPWHPPEGPFLAGGCFVASDRGIEGPGAAGDRAWAAAVCIQGRRTVSRNVVTGDAGAPYEPGLLFLRFGHLLLRAVEGLATQPDVLLVNGTGRDHPRRAGLAHHLGSLLDLPTVGVTDRTLSAGAVETEDEPGARSALLLGHDTVGCSLRVRRGVKPIIAHAAWRTDADTALEVVRRALGRGRTPVPIREARRLARSARNRDQAIP